MTRKRGIGRYVAPFEGRELDARYLGFFECFNRQLFFEAHEVLEALWLTERAGPKDRFYKGLIQLAGAFVHLQRGRVQPAAALFRLALGNLRDYPALYEGLAVAEVVALIESWILRLAESKGNPYSIDTAPCLVLGGADTGRP